jgi:hypothetical protein
MTPVLKRRRASFVGFTLLAGLSIACGGGAGSADEGATAGQTETGTGDAGETAGEDGGGMCVEVQRQPAIIDVTVDGVAGVPTLAATCTVNLAGHSGDTATLALDCTDDQDSTMHSVEMTAVASALPAGLDTSPSLQLQLFADDTSNLGSGPRIQLSDTDGPILAQIQYSTGGTSWGPVAVDYATDCPAEDESGVDTYDGFVRATVDDVMTDVPVGEQAVVTNGTHSWDLHSLYAYSQCCHGASIDAAIVRH